MGRPKKVILSETQKIRLIQSSGVIGRNKSEDKVNKEEIELVSIQSRIKQILSLTREVIKPNEMHYLIMYDIENNKVRVIIAKYLLSKGCVRIQKSVFLAKTKYTVYQEICKNIKEIQELYHNKDSIIFVPITSQSLGSMEIIGKEIQISAFIDPPNTLFF